MTHQLISLLVLFIYFGMLAKAVQYLCKKIFDNTFDGIGRKSVFTTILTIPALLLIPLSQAFFELSQMSEFFDTITLLGRQAKQIAVHFGASILGLFLLLAFGRLFIANTPTEEADNIGHFTGLLLICVIVAILMFPFLSDILMHMVPKQEIQGFR
jgi:hypothetical protein